jgi:hypothetical protein
MRTIKIAAFFAVFVLVSNVVFADLIVDLRATSINGVATDGSKNFVVAAGDVLTCQIWAQVTGFTSPRLMGLKGTIGEIAGAVKGDMSYKFVMDEDTGAYGGPDQIYVAAIADGSPPNLVTNAFGDKDITSTSFPFAATSAGTGIGAVATYKQVGQFSYTVKSAAPGTATTLSFNPINDTDSYWTVSGALHFANEQGQAYTTTGPISLTAVPEPSTLVLLGLGALALVFVRRK